MAMAFTFEWDPRKAGRNLKKHGVSFLEALTVFQDPLGQVVDDDRHSIAEQRHALSGLSHRRRLLVVMFTERVGHIRIISARRATNLERAAYEEIPR
ncbi:MAG: BrnT family toxin [Gemmatimonadaceae bacterium]